MLVHRKDVLERFPGRYPRGFFSIVLLMTSLVALPASAGRIEIKESGGAEVRAYIYKPSGKGAFPAIIVLHHAGGLTDDITDFAEGLSGKGYITLALDFSTGSGWANSTAAAYDYLQRLPEVDARRTAMVGFSKGARMGMQIAIFWKHVQPPRPVRAFVSYYIGNSIDVEPTPDLPPFLFLHGDSDPEVSAREVVAFCDEQKKFGKICEAKILRGTTHAFTRKTFYGDHDYQATAESFKQTVTFLNKYVRDAPIQ